MTLPARHPLSVTRVLPCALALAFSQSGHAEEDDQKTTSGHNYLVGAMALSQPDYEGSERRIIKLRPLWAYQWGRFRLSTSRSAAAMNFASDPQGPGASALLVDGNRFRFGGALRFDSGRQSGDSPRLNGLPDVERTLRGRVFVGYKLSDRWDVSANVSQDLLGRQGERWGASISDITSAWARPLFGPQASACRSPTARTCRPTSGSRRSSRRHRNCPCSWPTAGFETCTSARGSSRR